MEKVFDKPGDFAAFDEAKEWLTQHGYSYGSLCGYMPVGILKGDWIIAKWRNLTPKERSQLHGQIKSEDFREGPVTVTLKHELESDQGAV